VSDGPMLPGFCHTRASVNLSLMGAGTGAPRLAPPLAGFIYMGGVDTHKDTQMSGGLQPACNTANGRMFANNASVPDGEKIAFPGGVRFPGQTCEIRPGTYLGRQARGVLSRRCFTPTTSRKDCGARRFGHAFSEGGNSNGPETHGNQAILLALLPSPRELPLPWHRLAGANENR